MELSQFTDYSLRVLIYAGLSNRLVSVPEIAGTYQISQHHLVKVVHHLSKHGFLDTFRGRGGGFRLAKKPSTWTVSDVVRTTENLALVECLSSDGGQCCLSSCCTLKTALAKARQAFLDVLEGYTIADLLQPQSALRQSLSLNES